MKIGLVGYGTGGQHFHAPFIDAAQGCELAGIVARAPQTIAKVQADYPDLPIYPSLAMMLEQGDVEAVTITTPPETRRELVLEAIAAGVHVIADKPFAPNAKAALELDEAARSRGVVLGVYQNRRYDSDLQTLKKIIDQNQLGAIWRIESRMDQNSPQTVEQGETGGLLRDLGSHVVDQMIYLLGAVKSVDAQMDYAQMEKGRTDVSFTIRLWHENGAHSHVSASKLNFIDQRELRIYGENGSYVSNTIDIQAQDLFKGKRPADDLAAWGYEPEAQWGILRNDAGEKRIPAAQGRYHDYYEAFAHAVKNGVEPPVTARQGAQVLAVLDAARESARIGQSVEVEKV